MSVTHLCLPEASGLFLSAEITQTGEPTLILPHGDIKESEHVYFEMDSSTKNRNLLLNTVLMEVLGTFFNPFCM